MAKLARYRQEKWQPNVEAGKRMFTECHENFIVSLPDFAQQQQLQFSPNAARRLERASLVLGDPISMRLREAAGGYKFGTGEVLMGIDAVHHSESFQQTVRHEFFHAASGHLLLRNRDMQVETVDLLQFEQTSTTQQLSRNDAATMRLYEAMFQEAAGLSMDDDEDFSNVGGGEMDFNFEQGPVDVTKYERDGLHFMIGRERFEWLSEATTEKLTESYQQYLNEPFLGGYYDKEKQLFDLLLTSGNSVIDRQIVFNAYLEDYMPSETSPRLPQWQKFMKQIVSSYGSGFLPHLDNVVQAKGANTAIELMRTKNFDAIMNTAYSKKSK